eukprot:gene3426-6065_t
MLLLNGLRRCVPVGTRLLISSVAIGTTAMTSANQPIRAVEWREKWNQLSLEKQSERKDLAEQLAGSDLLGDRIYHLQTYKNCFVASDAVRFLIEKGFAASRQEATEKLQELVESNLIHHVTHDNTFSNNKLFFRLTSEDLGPSIFTIAGEKKNLILRATISGLGLFRMSTQRGSVVTVEHSSRKLMSFVNDIATAPQTVISINETMSVQDSKCATGCGVIVSSEEARTKLQLTFEDADAKDRFIEAVVSCGGQFQEDISDLVKNATSLYDFVTWYKECVYSFYIYYSWNGGLRNIQMHIVWVNVNDGFEVIAFPSNQFRQETKDNEAILAHARSYGAEFPVMSKVSVNGSNTHPIFMYLKRHLSGSFGSFIKWNYTKFVCDSKGCPVKRFGPNDAPDLMEPVIRELLGLPGEDTTQATTSSSQPQSRL